MKKPDIIPLLGRVYACCLLFFLPVKLFPVRKRIGNGGEFLVHPRFLFRDFSKWGEKINPEFNLLLDKCKGGKIVLDIGAHIGLFTLPIGRTLSYGGTVYAFEPATREFTYLLYHVEINRIKNAIPINAVVGLQAEEKVDFYEYDDETGLSSVQDFYDDARKSCKRQVSLDSFCGENKIVPDLIKIDVEGSEFDVIVGAQETLMKHGPELFVSIHPLRLAKLGKKEEDFFDLLDRIGYGLYTLGGERTSRLESGEFIMKRVMGRGDSA